MLINAASSPTSLSHLIYIVLSFLLIPSLGKFAVSNTFNSSSTCFPTELKMTIQTPVRASPVLSSTFLEAIKYRRTIYGVTDNIPVSDDRIIEIVNEVIQTIPSSWNMQSTRIVVTLGEAHKKFWDAVINAARPFVLETRGESDWKRNEERFNSFRAAYGTVRAFLPVPRAANCGYILGRSLSACNAHSI